MSKHLSAEHPQLSRELSREDVVLLGILIQLALLADINFSLEFNTGRYIDGKDSLDENGKLIPIEEIPDSKVIQGPQGFLIEVGGSFFENDDGDPELHQSLLTAVNAGLQILYDLMSKKLGDVVTDEMYGKYFKVIN